MLKQVQHDGIRYLGLGKKLVVLLLAVIIPEPFRPLRHPEFSSGSIGKSRIDAEINLPIGRQV